MLSVKKLHRDNVPRVWMRVKSADCELRVQMHWSIKQIEHENVDAPLKHYNLAKLDRSVHEGSIPAYVCSFNVSMSFLSFNLSYHPLGLSKAN